MMTPDQLTPAEMQDLGIVAARARMLRDDLAPMVRTSWRGDGLRIESVIPWRDAIELEDERMG